MSSINPPIPSTFQDFAGQLRVKERLSMAIEAASIRREPLGHVLFVGPTGLGKATLAYILVKTMGVNVVVAAGPVIERAGDLAGLLTKLETGDALFIEEIHRLPRAVAEYLCQAMDDFRLNIVVDQGPNARRVALILPRFTVIGSTYSSKQVSPLLLSHFPIVERLDYYDAEDLVIILRRAADIHGIDIDDYALGQIAEHAAGTPRAACNLLQHVRDYAQARRQSQRLNAEIVSAAFEMLELEDRITEAGFERNPIPREVRIEVWRRDGGKCARCGSREKLEFDHIIPVAKGGGSTARNIELLCETCNRSKSGNIR